MHRQRERVEKVVLGAGANGMAFVEGPRVSVAFEGDVVVYFQGALNRGLSFGCESPATDILHKYVSGQLSTSECTLLTPPLPLSPNTRTLPYRDLLSLGVSIVVLPFNAAFHVSGHA